MVRTTSDKQNSRTFQGQKVVFKDKVSFINLNSLTPFHKQNTQISHLTFLDSSGFVDRHDETIVLVSVQTFCKTTIVTGYLTASFKSELHKQNNKYK